MKFHIPKLVASVAAIAQLPWNLDILDGVMNNKYAHRYTGKGVAVYILDTGINTTRVPARLGPSFVDTPTSEDDNGHGTIVASIVHAVAPEARLVALKVMAADGVGTLVGLLVSFFWLISKASALTLPQDAVLWAEQDCKSHHCILHFSGIGSIWQELDTIVSDSPLSFVAAAGNEAADAAGYSPGCAALLVGAFTPAIDWWPENNYGPCVRLLAPGVDVFGWTGTSMAAPHITGLLAQVYEVHHKCSKEACQSILLTAAQPLVLSVPAGTTNRTGIALLYRNYL